MFRTHAEIVLAAEGQTSTASQNSWSVNLFASSPSRPQSIETISKIDSTSDSKKDDIAVSASALRRYRKDRTDVLITAFDLQKIAESKKSLIHFG